MSSVFRYTFLSALMILSVMFVSDVWRSEASNDKSKRKTSGAENKKVISEIKLTEFQAEKFSDGVKISWQSGFENQIVGFRVWRENGGERQVVNTEIIGGSLLKTANGLFENGSEYVVFDRTGDYQTLYRLEALQADGQSVWFGHFAVVAGKDVSAELPEKADQPQGLTGQINRVEFTSGRQEKISGAANFQSISDFVDDPSAIKFNVRTNGWYRIEPSDLTLLGFQNELLDDWKLFANGVEQPIKLNADGSIEFYGRGIDTFYSDARVYWLTRVAGTGKRVGKVLQSFNKSAQSGWSRTVAERKDRVLRAPGILNGGRENWFAGFVYSVPLNQTLNLSEIALESRETATLSVDLQGVSGYPHRVVVLLNGNEIGQISFNYAERKEWSINLPLSSLVEGNNTLTFTGVLTSDYSLLEAVRINYPRRMKAENNQLNFTTAARQKVKLTGFTNPNIRIFDITNPEFVTEFASKSRLESDGTYCVTFDSGTSARVLTAQTSDIAPLRANPLILNTPSNLRDPSNRAKFIIIGRSEVFGYFQELRQRREAEGLATKLVDISDIYDEFNYGIKSADAIRDFLRHAKENWAVKPEYVLIAGDASVDPRNYSGLGGDTRDIVPAMFVDTWSLEAVTDEMMADFNGDSIGEIAVGRLPYRTNQDLEAMMNKIYAFNPMSLSEINQRGVVFVSDALQGYDFATASRNIASPIPAGVVPYYIDRGSQDSTVVKNMILAKINSGAVVVNYFGHGQIYNWTSASILHNNDAPNLINATQPSLMSMVACLNGAFAETNLESLAEAVMKTPTGGAFAVWSASASNAAQDQEYLAKEYNRRVFSGMRLGDAVRETKATTLVPDIRRTYIFFGDPTQRIVRQ